MHYSRKHGTCGARQLLAVFAIMALARGVISQAAFGGEVLSVSTIDSCQSLPDGGTTGTVFGSDGRPPAGGGPCSVLGTSSSFTLVELSLTSEQVKGGETLTFEIPGPNVGTAGLDGTDCVGTRRGSDCTIFANGKLSITIETGDFDAMYGTGPPIDVPWATYWAETKPSSGASVNCPQCPAGLDNYSGFFVAKPSDLGYPVTPDGQPDPFTVADAPAPVVTSAISSVCPAPNSAELSAGQRKYFPQFPIGNGQDGNDQSNYYTFDQSADPDILFCPTLSGVGNEVTSWQAGYMMQLYPTCTMRPLLETPRILFNARVTASIGNEQTTVGVIDLSTLQDGAFVTDTSGRLVAALLDIETPGGFVAPDIGGSITVCGAVPATSAGSSAAGASNQISDFLAVNDGAGPTHDFDIAYTQNVWTTTDGGKAAIKANAALPNQFGRRILLQDEEVTGMWHYRNSIDTALSYGGGLNSLNQKPYFYTDRADAAELICAGGMGGTGMPGYQQTSTTFGARYATTTDCQLQLEMASTQADSETNGRLGNYAFALPLDYNPAAPQYAWDYTRLIRTIPGNDGLNALAQLMLPATYTGDELSFAGGEFVTTNMICSVPDNTNAGIIVVTIENTGASAGGYEVTATFSSQRTVAPTATPSATATATPTPSGDPTPVSSTDDVDGTTTSYTVTDVQGCTLQLEAGQMGTCEVQYAYSGPIDQDLIADLTLLSTVIQSGTSQPVLAFAEVGCAISYGINVGGAFGSTNIGAGLGDGDPPPPPPPSELGLNFWQWLALAVLLAILALIVALIMGLGLWCLYNSAQEQSANKKTLQAIN